MCESVNEIYVFVLSYNVISNWTFPIFIFPQLNNSLYIFNVSFIRVHTPSLFIFMKYFFHCIYLHKYLLSLKHSSWNHSTCSLYFIYKLYLCLCLDDISVVKPLYLMVWFICWPCPWGLLHDFINWYYLMRIYLEWGQIRHHICQMITGTLDCIASIKLENCYTGGFLSLMPPVVPLGMQKNVVTPKLLNSSMWTLLLGACTTPSQS